MPYKTVIRLVGVARKLANGFPARLPGPPRRPGTTPGVRAQLHKPQCSRRGSIEGKTTCRAQHERRASLAADGVPRDLDREQPPHLRISGAHGPWATPPRRSGSPPPGTAGPKPHGPGCKRRRDVGPVVHLVSAPACGGNAKNPSNPVRSATNAIPGVTPPSLLAAAPWSAPPASPDSS